MQGKTTGDKKGKSNVSLSDTFLETPGFLKNMRLSTKLFFISTIFLVFSCFVFNIIIGTYTVELTEYIDQVNTGQNQVNYDGLIPCFVAFGFLVICFFIWIIAFVYMMFRGVKKNLFNLFGDMKTMIDIFPYNRKDASISLNTKKIAWIKSDDVYYSDDERFSISKTTDKFHGGDWYLYDNKTDATHYSYSLSHAKKIAESL